METKKKVTIYTDGSARGNPDGPGGYGSVLQYVDSKGTLHEREFSEGFVRTTNNQMELMGVIVALEALRFPCEVDLYSDSQYVIKAFNEHWIDNWIRKGWKTATGSPVKNRELWERLLRAANPHDIHFHWVKGHNGDPLNERCDALATQAADSVKAGSVQEGETQ